MKIFKNLLTGAMAVILIVSSCTNPAGDYGVDQPRAYDKVYSAQAVAGRLNVTLTIPVDTVFDVTANFGGLDYPGNDIAVKFKVAPELVAPYNQDNGTTYPMMPDDSYSVENTEVTIPKGKLISSPVKVQVKTSELQGIGKYVLPVTIEHVSEDVPVVEDMRTVYLLVNGTYESNPFPLYDRGDWSVAGFSSEESYDQSWAVNVLDGDILTFWQTCWKYSKPGPPHRMTLDMGVVKEIHGFELSGRTISSSDTTQPREKTNPRDIVIETSRDGINWDYSEPYSLENILVNTLYLSYVQETRYFRITVNSSQGDTYNVHIAEINAF